MGSPNQSKKDMVYYNDTWMVRGWPERIRQAQKFTAFERRGKKTPRIPYGNERVDWHAEARNCHDCGVLSSQYHVPGCDLEQCPVCRSQAAFCDCGWYTMEEIE